MASYDDDDSGDDFAFLALVLAGGYFFWQFYRARIAAESGGGVFEGSAPAEDYGTGILDILVPLSLSPTGYAFIKNQEGFSPTPYPDGGKTSIGYGHQIQPGENIVPPITRAEGERLLAADTGAAAQDISTAVKVMLTQNQFDALTDFRFNIGRQNFLKSTLLAKLNAGDYAGASSEFSRWVHSGGQVSPVLEARRSADQTLFNGG